MWPGFLTKRQGGYFYVTGSALDEIQDGDRIISCNDRDIEAYAAANLGVFTKNWKWEANQIKAAPYLFLDQGNPFVERPQFCTFMRDTDTFSQTLNYSSARNNAGFNAAQKTIYRRPTTFSIQPFDENGFWIKLPQLSGKGYQLAKDAHAQTTKLRSADYVVIDVRGNSGGNSSIGDQFANTLGLAQTTPNHTDDFVHWRLSDDNIQALQAYEKDENLSINTRKYISEMITEAREGIENNNEFSPALSATPNRLTSIQSTNADPQNARVLLLTDQYCFSSCLMLAQRFIEAGAAHIGVITDGNSWYMEVSRRPLPSGHTSFSTMMKVNFNYREALGPYKPRIAYQGDISDTNAVQTWVKSLRHPSPNTTP